MIKKSVSLLSLIASIRLYILMGKSNTPYRLVLFYDSPEAESIIPAIKRLKKDGWLGQTVQEAYQIFTAVQRTSKIDGDIAEVGVAAGGTAKLICETKGNRMLHLFDTFNGLPDPGINDNPRDYSRGDYAFTLKAVSERLAGYSNVKFYEGLFPETSKPVEYNRFSLVHLDVDLYQSTMDCLNFFYPRMNRGGIIISHDYRMAQGVKRAFDEFMADKNEIIIEPAGTQCLVAKV